MNVSTSMFPVGRKAFGSIWRIKFWISTEMCYYNSIYTDNLIH